MRRKKARRNSGKVYPASIWDRFTIGSIGFWHPFGPYGGLSEAEIVRWKRGEAEGFGWTFWSFAYSPSAHLWLKELSNVSRPVFAFCSHSPAAIDPYKHQGQPPRATDYKWLDDAEWHRMADPDLMKVTNPFKRRGFASAFRVSHVFDLEPLVPPFEVEWFSKKERGWRSDNLPMRGEFLVRRGRGTRLRKVRVVLELSPPYLLNCVGSTIGSHLYL